MATIDTSIYNALLKPVRSIDEYRGDMDAREMNALALQGKRVQMQQAQQSMQRQNALQGYLQGGNITAEGLAQHDPKLAMDWRESQSKVTKDAADTQLKGAQTQASQLEAARKKIDMTLQVLSGARDQQSYAQGVQMLQANGIDVSTIPPQFDPAFVQTAAQQALSVKERLDALDASERRKLTASGQAETARHNQTSERISAGNLAVAQGNLGLSRERLAQEKAAPRGQFLETPDGYVLGNPKDGSVAPVMDPATGKQVRGKSADRALTDSQAKANLFGSRMRDSHAILTSLEGKYSPASVKTKVGAENLPVVGGVAGWAGNAMLSEEDQQAEQAMRDFINAVLRRESGAVINPNEFDNAEKQYFPSPNDGPKVLKQKREARERATRLMLEEVPNSHRGRVPTLSGNTGGAGGSWGEPSPDGVKFLGFEPQ
jgi:hypothetical protein